MPPSRAETAGNLAASPLPVRRESLSLDQLATKALMKALPIVVGHEFPDDMPEMSRAEEDQVIQALLLAPDALRARSTESRSRGAVAHYSTSTLAALMGTGSLGVLMLSQRR